MTQNRVQPTPSAVPAAEAPVLSLIVLANFLPASHRAIRYAAELAAPLGAQLVLLHVQEVSVLAGELLAPPAGNEDDLLAAVQALADEAYVPTSVELLPDLQPATATDLARRYSPALFVLGHATEPAAEGEVSAAVLQVLRSGQFPLLLVPEAYAGTPAPRRVLVAVDGEPFELNQPGAALQLLAALEPHLTVVTVSAVEDARLCVTALRQMKASGLAAVARHVTPEAIHSGYPVEGLRQAIATTRPDLVVLIARPRSFLSAMFHRSVTSRLLDGCPVPVLLLPARGD